MTSGLNNRKQPEEDVIITFWSVIVTLWSVIVTLWSVIVTLWSVIVTFWSVIVTIWSVIVTFWSVIVTLWSVIITIWSVIVTFWSVIVTFWSHAIILNKKPVSSTSFLLTKLLFVHLFVYFILDKMSAFYCLFIPTLQLNLLTKPFVSLLLHRVLSKF